MKAAVIGAGSWGSALASVLCTNGHETTLWARNVEVVQEIEACSTNRKYLKDAQLPVGLKATTDLREAVQGAELILFAVPSGIMPEILLRVKGLFSKDALLAHAVKGFDHATKRRMSVLMSDTLQVSDAKICVISGPSHAEEVVAQLPTTIVVASASKHSAEMLQDALMNSKFRVYTNPDVVGAELGGSLKNIIALGVGIADGLGFGDNAKAALMTRGLAEISRLGVKLGASPLTFAGLSGVGDLIVTCTSQHSRNFRAGRLLGQGLTVDDALKSIGMAVEGIPTTKSTYEIAADLDVNMPITTAIYHMLFKGKSPVDAVEELMGRDRVHEIEEVAHNLSPTWLP